MHLFILVLTFACFLTLTHLTTLKVSRSNHWFTTKCIFSSNDWELQIVGLVHVNIFGSFSDRSSGKSFLVSTLLNQKRK